MFRNWSIATGKLAQKRHVQGSGRPNANASRTPCMSTEILLFNNDDFCNHVSQPAQSTPCFPPSPNGIKKNIPKQMSIISASSPEKQHVRLSPSQERTCVTASCNRIFLCSAKRCQSEKYVLLFLVQTYSNIHMFKTLFAVVCRVTPKVIHMSPKLWAHRVVRTACSHHIRFFFVRTVFADNVRTMMDISPFMNI